ncbi:MAG: NADH-quinone oxidoreductase subunit NuoB [Deltaproteobacteria bacterium]|nr:NADH-quinone oxidoreductase subunit NuoB [Deltaproteobacteria bacterium]
MLKTLLERLHQGGRTVPFPYAPPTLPDRLRGPPTVDASRCVDGCTACVDACPTGALGAGALTLDLGRCLLCPLCAEACPTGALSQTHEYRLATRSREALLQGDQASQLATALEAKSLRVLGRALKLRQVSAGGCNACEADVNVLNTVVFDLSRFGIQFVASPRHADGLLITGPVSDNMRLALQKTWEALPEPRIVIAVGACAISGGPYLGHDEVHGGAAAVVPVDLFVPGCPPHPITILDGLLRLLGKIEDQHTEPFRRPAP